MEHTKGIPTKRASSDRLTEKLILGWKVKLKAMHHDAFAEDLGDAVEELRKDMEEALASSLKSTEKRIEDLRRMTFEPGVD